jgi:anthranilate phosphoribosyltransferase
LSGQVIGVFEPRLLDVVGEAIQSIGRSEVMVIHAHDGFDELSNTCENDVIWIADGQLKRIRIHPKVIGKKIAKLENIVINSREESIRDTLRAIYGTASTEKQDIVVLNAAAALVVNKITDNIKEGVELARAALREGSPQKKLFALIQSCGNVSKLKEAEQEFL